jgi:hypothetical protein
MYAVTREEMQETYFIACSVWRTHISYGNMNFLPSDNYRCGLCNYIQISVIE